ncbi:MAG: hypothetical protein KGL43_27440, partial [Burkholderiales bacterium]|nr:hypothetical protein [Burkholderiales bacterium]
IARDAAAAVAAAEQAGRKPEEAELLRLADAQQRSGNAAGRLATVNKLLLDYPKPAYWSAALAGLQRSSGFSDRYTLDLMRLRLASGTLSRSEDFMEMAQLALQARLPAEALAVLDQGYKQGALGSGPGAARQQRLKDLALRQLAQQKQALPAQTAEAQKLAAGDDLVRVGYAWVTLGQDAQGIALIGQGLAKGRLEHPGEARLHLGMAQLQSAATRASGVATLRSIHGSDGAADLARLWLIAPHP